MDTDRREAERARLHGYIADSLRLRRRLTRALIPVAVIALVATFFARTPGLIALVIAVSSIGVGVYITSAQFSGRTCWDDLASCGRPSRGRRTCSSGSLIVL